MNNQKKENSEFNHIDKVSEEIKHQISASQGELNTENSSHLEASLRKYRAMRELEDSFWEINLLSKKITLSLNNSIFKVNNNANEQDYDYWLNLIHPDDKFDFQHQIEDPTLQKNDKITAELRVSNGKNKYRWVMVRGVVTEITEEGLPYIITGLFSNISSLKKAQLNTLKTNFRLSTTISSLNNGILLEDEKRNIILTNQSFCDLFEIPLPPPDMIGLNCEGSAEQAKHLFKDPELFVSRINDILKEKKKQLGEVLEMADGRVLTRDFIPISVDDKYFGHLWKYQDITDTQLTEKLLRSSEEKYRSIIANMNLGLLEVDNKELILYANESFCNITGYSQEELIGNEASNFFLQGEGADIMRHKNRQRKDGIADMYEIPIKDKNGNPKWLLISGAPLYNEFQELIGSIGIHLDITDQKNLEKELREAKLIAEESSKAKEIFLANMSHEIRTPMNAILGMSNLLQKTNLNSDQNNYLRAINTSAENLLVIINDILDLTKIDAGKLKIEQVDFDLTELLDQLNKMFYYKVEEKGLLYKINTSPDLPLQLKGDPYRINQVLVNLVGNAVKFTQEGGIEVNINLESKEGSSYFIKFEVKDTGIGMNEEYKERLFQDFSQEDTGITRKYGGTGLGLAISRKLINLMEGSIEIKSKKDKGTTISFVIPLSIGQKKQEVKPTIPTEQGEESLKGSHVLLVEDNEFNRLLASTILTAHGATVTEAPDGLEATKIAQQKAFDIILMDIQMPIMNGYEATKYIRENISKEVPIIAQTANAVKGESEKCLNAGMNDYITKPFEEQDLIAKILLAIKPSENIIAQKKETYPEETSNKKQAYNIDMLEQMSRGDHEFIKKMLKTVLDTMPPELDKIKQAYANKDYKTVKLVAHKIKPSLLNLKFEAAPVMREIELWPDDGDHEEMGNKITWCLDKIAQVLDEIKRDHF